MVTAKGVVRASSGYGLSVITGGIISVLVIPTVIIVAGSQTWATIAVAQGVAGFGMVLVSAGWGVTGPTETASMPDGQRSQFYVDSLVSRTWLFVVTGLVCSAITLLLVNEQPAIAILALLSALVPGLSAGWFFVGESSALRFLFIETAPRQIGSLLGAVMLFVTGDALWFVGLQLAGGVVATVLSSASIMRRYPGWHVDLSLSRAILRMREHIPAVSMSAVSTLYVNLPIVVVQIFLPSYTAVYALAERIMRLALYATRPYVQVAQGYVPNDDVTVQLRRSRRITRLTLLLGVIGGAMYAIAGPWVGLLLSGGQLHVDYAVSISLGVALAAMLVSQVTGFAVLTTFHLTKHLAWSTVAGAIVGCIALVPSALLFGVEGVAAVLGLSEAVVLIYQLVVLRRTFRTLATPREAPTIR